MSDFAGERNGVYTLYAAGDVGVTKPNLERASLKRSNWIAAYQAVPGAFLLLRGETGVAPLQDEVAVWPPQEGGTAAAPLQDEAAA